MELDMIEFTGMSDEQKLASLPLMSDRDIKALIWNLLVGEKTKKKISYTDYGEILDILIERRNKSDKN